MSKKIKNFIVKNEEKTSIKPGTAARYIPYLSENVINISALTLEISQEFKGLTTYYIKSSDFIDACNRVVNTSNAIGEELRASMLKLIEDTHDRIKKVSQESKGYTQELQDAETAMRNTLQAFGLFDGKKVSPVGETQASDTPEPTPTPAPNPEPPKQTTPAPDNTQTETPAKPNISGNEAILGSANSFLNGDQEAGRINENSSLINATNIGNTVNSKFGGTVPGQQLNFNGVDLGTGNGYSTSPEFSEQLSHYLSKMSSKPDDGKYLKRIGEESLYNVSDITPEQLQATLAEIQATSTGRDAVARSAMAMIGGAAEAGYWLNYKHQGTSTRTPHVPTSKLVNGGVDCNAYASWLVDKGVPGGMVWRRVEDFRNIGDPVSDYSTLQCGDVYMTYSNEHTKHVGVIMENHPEGGYVITSESSNGIQFKKKTYSELQNSPGISVRDMTNVYNGTYDVNSSRIEDFNRSGNQPDWDTYQRPW